MDRVGNLEAPQSIRLAISDLPAVSKCIQVPDDGPIGLHVFISTKAIVVSTQSSDVVPVGAGEDNFWKEKS